MTKAIEGKPKIIPPPEPYSSWLEYAVACPDVAAHAQSDCWDESRFESRDDIRFSVVSEYVSVCEAAGIKVPQKTVRDLLNFRVPNFKRLKK